MVCCATVQIADPPTEADVARRGTRCVRAADGSNRLVEYSVHGSTREDAKWVINGYAALPSDIPPPYVPLLEQLNVKEVNISVPGLGASTIQPGSKIDRWPRDDVTPVMEALGITGKFYVYGGSRGTQCAMAMALHFGPDRIVRMGLRAPYIPRPLSKELKMQDGQWCLPTSDELLRNTLKARCYKCMIAATFPTRDPDPSKKLSGKFEEAYPELAIYQYKWMVRNMTAGHYGPEAFMFLAASDTLLDVPGLDIRKIKADGFQGSEKVIVWYGDDDEDCPPAHGKWLAEFFEAETRVLTGFGHAGAEMAVDAETFFKRLLRD